MFEKFNLDGKTALITGGSRGIGLGIACSLADAGADVYLLARGSDDLNSARNTLSKPDRRVWTRTFDMSEIDSIPDMFQSVSEETGGIEILVNNAGTTARGAAHEQSIEEWRRVIDVNLTSVFALSRVFAKARIDAGLRGKIVNIASLMSEQIREDNAPYAASKGGIRQLTKALAVDWARYGINVNAIGPGFIRTELTRRLWENPEFDEWVKWKTPWGRWGEAEDIGNAALFLASSASNYITGQILYVDGGMLTTFGPSSWPKPADE